MAEEIYLSRGKRYAIDVIGQAPREINKDDFEAGALQIMQAQLDALSDELSAKSADLAELKTNTDASRERSAESLRAARAAIANTALDDKATVAAVTAIFDDAELPERAKKLLELQGERAKLDAQIAALGG